MTGSTSLFRTTAIVACAAFALSACGTNIFNRDAAPQAPIADARQADANGVITYDSFRVIVANDRDTIADLAQKVGLTDVVLARYNGLPTNYLLRAGDRLALPDEAQVEAVSEGWTPEVVTGVLDDLPEDADPGQAPVSAPGVQLTRHRVERGETAFSIARLYGVSVTALASWNGLTGDLEVGPGRSLVIPPSDARPALAPQPVATEPAPPTSPTNVTEPGTSTAVALPPSADAPLPDDIDPEVETVESPQMAAADGVTSNSKFLTPVKGKVVRGYSKAPGRDKNEGLDFETAKGAPVMAAESGEVALISRSLGGLGTIVLIRHRDDIMTVYGRINDVKVKKGDPVKRGQTIGNVADADRPIFHFEVRRGTQSIDPTPFL